MHVERIFDNQELPEKIDVAIVKNLTEIGPVINALPEGALSPNCQIETFDGSLLPAVWYPHSKIPRSERRSLDYRGVDFKGIEKRYSFLPSGWVLTEHNWFPLVTRLLRVIGERELVGNPDYLKRVTYQREGLRIDEEQIKSGKINLLASLGAAENVFCVVYLTADRKGKILSTATKNNWLVHDKENVGYKSCGVGERVYGPGCYFGGFWVCADRGSAKKVDAAVCKVKTPPWPTRYFWAIVDDVVFNAGEGSSIKAGRIKILNEDQDQKIPSWVIFPSCTP